jgi:hypothetical protein
MNQRSYLIVVGAFLAGVCLLLAGCERKGRGVDPGGAGGSEPALGELPSAVAGQPGPGGLVTLIRPMVSRLADREAIRIALHWETEKGPIEWQDERHISWAETWKKLTVHLTTPDGRKHALRLEGKPVAEHGPVPLSSTATLLLTLNNEGLTSAPWEYRGRWVGDSVPPLDQPGTYRIAVAGQLVGETRSFQNRDEKAPIALPFESGEVAVELGVPGYRPLADIEEIATKHLKARRKVEPREGRYLYEDRTGNRLVRFTGPEEEYWTHQAYTVVVAPDGTPGQIVATKVSTCIAAGTLIEGEDGPRPVEQVRPGDRVWGYDLEKQARQLTTVAHVRPGRAEPTVLLARGLRVTPDHPVLGSGEWKPAGRILPEDLLLDPHGRPFPAGPRETLSGAVAVFDLSVGPPHNFYAGGVLVHNKTRIYSPDLDDVWYVLWPRPKPKQP